MSPTISAHPFVRLHNNGDTDLRVKYADGQPLLIPAYGYMIVPWETACYLCGNPELQNLNPRQPLRDQALHRLKVYYGVSHLNDDDAVAEFPDITVQTPDGVAVPMIIHDPSGAQAPWRDGAAPSPEVDILRRQIEELARSQQDLLALLAAREQVSPAVSGMGAVGDNPATPAHPVFTPAKDEANDVDDEITFDTPRRTRIGRG